MFLKQYWPAFFALLLFVPHPSKAQPLGDPERYLDRLIIAPGLYQGKHLIYDCSRKSFICVKDFHFEGCKVQRDEHLAEFQVNLGCAPLKAFNSVKECILFQKKAIETPALTGFCRHHYEGILSL